MMLRTQEAVMRGEPPVGAMLDGGMSVMAGLLLIMPGLITDALGLILLIPPARHFLANRLAAGLYGVADVEVGVYEARPQRDPRAPGGGASGLDNGGPVIEGDFERLDERTVDPNKGRPPTKS
jgi:UPF0716 protein FxsA